MPNWPLDLPCCWKQPISADWSCLICLDRPRQQWNHLRIMHCRSRSGPFDLRGGPFDVWQRGPGPPWPGQQTGDLVRDKWWPCIDQSLPIRTHGEYWGENIEGSHTNTTGVTHCQHLPRDGWSGPSPGWSCHETWGAQGSLRNAFRPVLSRKVKLDQILNNDYIRELNVHWKQNTEYIFGS